MVSPVQTAKAGAAGPVIPAIALTIVVSVGGSGSLAWCGRSSPATTKVNELPLDGVPSAPVPGSGARVGNPAGAAGAAPEAGAPGGGVAARDRGDSARSRQTA